MPSPENSAYIYDHVRSPRGKGKKDGSLHQITALDLSKQVLESLKDRSDLDTGLVDDVMWGCVTPVGEQGGDIARAAVLAANYAETTGGVQVNRFCASALEAVNIAAAKVVSGEATMAIGGGVECMSRVPMGSDGGAWAIDVAAAFPTHFVPQGVSADMIASKWGFSRTDVDAYSVESHKRAAQSWAEGRFKNAIVPIKDQMGVIALSHDETIRPGTDMQTLGGLNPSFAAFGEMAFDSVIQQRYPEIERVNHVHTPGNSSSIVDGAAAVLVGSKEAGKLTGMKPKARILGTASIGSEPSIMLTGPAYVTEKLLKKLGMNVSDIDLYELNEAFAAVVLRYMQVLDIPHDKINVCGGAIAMGHPLGATGAMILGTLADELERSGKSTGLAVLCVGGGMATATVIERAFKEEQGEKNMETFKTELDADGILLCTFDVPGKSMNTFTKQALTDLAAIAEQAKNDAAVKGVVLTSGKTTGFCAGADLEEMLSGAWEAKDVAQDEQSILKANFDAAFEMNRVYRLLETCGKPVAVAINGLALGGGLEVSLACHYRVLSNGPKVQVGFPEIKIGLFPGGGGSQRLPRLIGVQAALMAMSEGKSFKPAEALAAGIVDEVVDDDKVVEAAKTWIKTKGDPVARWDKKDYKIPGGGPYHPAGAQIFIMGNALIRKQSFGNYPAVINLMHSVYEGLQVPFDTAIKIESRFFCKTLATPQAKAMIRTFFMSMQAIGKGSGRPAGVPKMDVTQVAVIGAGMMGAGIAYVSALAGIKTILLDRDQASADKGKAHCEDLLKKSVLRGKMTQEKAQGILDLITATPDYAAITGSDLVVEAVFENTDLKEQVTKQAEAPLYANGRDAPIFGTNTSTIPISLLATASSHAENYIGIHFFSPVDKMMLVEIIRGAKTSDASVAKAIDYALKIKKTPVVVNDSRFFFANRCFIPFTAEGMIMWSEGVAPALIDNAGRMTGMPRGPLEMMDDVALDLLTKITSETAKAMGDAYTPIPGEKEVAQMVADGRLGRKNGKGFYDYPEAKGAPKTLWQGTLDMFPVKVTEANPAEVEELKKRLLYVQAVTAARCFEEGVITNPREADVGSILGWGFAPWSGGIISLMDAIGIAKFVEELDRLTKLYGDRFAPPQLLRDMAAKGETFYGRFDPKVAKAA